MSEWDLVILNLELMEAYLLDMERACGKMIDSCDKAIENLVELKEELGIE